MSLLDMTPREMAQALRLWPARKWRRLSYRVRRAIRPPGPIPPTPRDVRSRFVGLGRRGEDVWLTTGLPASMTFPVQIASGAASFRGEDEPITFGGHRFGARVFHFNRVTAADHIGPTEAEYREVER